MNSLPKTVTRQRRDCDLNSGPSAPESSTLATRLPTCVDLIVEELGNQAATKSQVDVRRHSWAERRPPS